MPFEHLSLELTPEHFEVWLDVKQRNCQGRLGKNEMVELLAGAREIGETALFHHLPYAGNQGLRRRLDTASAARNRYGN
jgi:hypothetical protein